MSEVRHNFIRTWDVLKEYDDKLKALVVVDSYVPWWRKILQWIKGLR